MNCKKGDLAVIVISAAGNEGRIVRCVGLTESRMFHIFRGPRWLIDKPVPDSLGGFIDSIADANLRPIRDPGEDATDEMVALLGKPASQPSKETA